MQYFFSAISLKSFLSSITDIALKKLWQVIHGAHDLLVIKFFVKWNFLDPASLYLVIGHNFWLFIAT